MLCASCATVEAIAPRSESEAADEPEADAPGAEVALDDRDLGQVTAGVHAGRPIDHERLGDEHVGHDLTRPHADHAHAGTAVPGDAQVAAGQGRDPNGVAHPVGHFRHSRLGDRAAGLQHDLGPELAQVGQEQQVGEIPRATAPRSPSPCQTAA